jgi:hypothetical protein
MRGLERLAKWRGFLAGWQLGTRPDTDPECQAVRDHREATLVLRAELTAMTGLLLDRGVFTVDDFLARLDVEADAYNEALAKRFPGVTATDDGLHLDLQEIQRRGTMQGWRP